MLTRAQWQQVEALLPQMTISDLLELRAMIDTNIATLEMGEQQEAQQEQTSEQGQQSGKSKGKGGSYVEVKMINGCGPYAYKRWREGGRLRSEYQGKAVVG